MEKNNTFGFKKVNSDTKKKLVNDVFSSVANKYDIMNDLMSVGIHRLWKRFTIDCSGVRSGQKVLDLGGGTGDLTAKFSRIVGEKGHVILADINNSMLNVGRDKLRDTGIVGNVHYVQANAEELPFPDDYFDAITISFCLRNVTDKDKAAIEEAFEFLTEESLLCITPHDCSGEDYDAFIRRALGEPPTNVWTESEIQRCSNDAEVELALE